jgi:hypothetical protein
MSVSTTRILNQTLRGFQGILEIPGPFDLLDVRLVTIPLAITLRFTNSVST